mgnify:CR=1 FL=1
MLFHFTIVFFFTSKTNDKEIYVVNLSEFREFSFVQPAPPKPKEIVKEKTIKKIEDKPIEQNKILDNKKKEIEKKKDVLSLKKIETKKSIEKVEKVIEPNKKIIQKEEVKKLNNSNETPDIKPQLQSQKQFSLRKNKSVINDKLLSEYLSFISYEINKMASKSYPIQSVKRREQGTIVSILTINKDGELLKIEIKDRAPKRLYKATTKILNLFKFPKPPVEILDDQGHLRIKIPVNYILK